MKLLLDMGLSPRTTAHLNRLGHEACHLRDRGLERLPDPDVVKLAESEQRIIVTFDLDYPRIIALQRMSKPSVILFRLERFTTDSLNALLGNLLETYEHELSSGAILVAGPYQVRIRTLPIW